MKLRVRVGKKDGRLELRDDEVTLGDLRRTLRQTFLPTLGFSPDAGFSITLNGCDTLTEDESSLEALGIVSGDLIVIVMDDIPQPDPAHEQPDPAHEQPGPAHEQPGPASDQPPATAQTSDNRPEYGREAATAGEAYDVADKETPIEEEGPISLPGPMLCSEAGDKEIPHSLETLYRSANCTSASDALIVATHLLMVETGYTEQGAKAASLPTNWKSSSGVYKLHYSHPLCGDSSASLFCLPMDKIIIINATLSIGTELKCVRRLQLNTESYINYPPQDGNLALVYRNLQKLSRLLKDHLVYPLLAKTRQALDLPDVFGLVVLPPELKLRIFRLLDIHTILSLGATCKKLHEDTEDQSLWRFICRRDFRRLNENDPQTDWKELYKKKYRVLCSKHRRYPPFVPEFPVPPNPFPHERYSPTLTYPPGIIGGEYDQHPMFPFARDPFSLLDRRRHLAPELFRPIRPPFDPSQLGPCQNYPQTRRPF